jgi:pyruvate dehydrogenase E2 component (dihydrolipoamide acetyltransferase)
MAIEITVPRLGWNMEEGVFQGWLKQDGTHVKSGEPIFALEGEKAVQEIEAIEGGILKISPTGPAVGSTVMVGTLIGYLLAEGEQVEFKLPAKQPDYQAFANQSPAPVQQFIATSQARTSRSDANSNRSGLSAAALTISPRAARTAAALGVDWVKICGTGRTGRIRERDVMAAVSGHERETTQVKCLTDEPQMPGRIVPVSLTRRTIARRMSAGIHEAAPVTLTVRADATNLVLARANANTALALDATSPTLNDYFVKLVAAAIQRHPSLNAQWHGDGIFHPDEINIAIAIDTDNGLVAPVIQNAPSMSVEQIAAKSQALIDDARNGRLTPEHLARGTFTVTNLGRLGIDVFTPIINLPQCAILGIGRVVREPVVLDDKIVARDLVPLSLTFDHRVVDGAPAAKFLESLVQLIESAGR